MPLMSIRIKGDYYRLLPGVLEKDAKLHSKPSQDGENKNGEGPQVTLRP